MERIRLACDTCDCDEFDGISEAKLEECRRSGWVNIGEEQSYEEAIKTYDDPHDEPRSYSVLDWWTHLGTCPSCAKESA